MNNLHLLIKKIRQFSVFLCMLFALGNSALAQNITRIEYFYDTDPGFGNGTAVSFTPAANISSLTFSASITSLSSGFHTLYIRSRDANNKWSLTNNQPFIKYQAPAGIAAATNIVKMEYFVDADPGFGAATNVPVTPGLDISNFSFNVSLASVSNGFHTLYVRTKDADGKWSLTNYGSFIKYQAPTGIAAATNIVKMEYFVDADPGFGAATNVPVTPGLDISNFSFNVSLASVSNGFHTLYVRTKDADGKWSLTNYGSFIKYQAPTGIAAATNIVKMEYFVDADPGFGAATNVPVTPGLDISNFSFNVSLASVSNGFHTLYVRTKDADGKWSLTNYGSFIKYQAPTGIAAATNIVKMEYFVDADPGFGAATNVPVTPGLDVSNFSFNVSLASVSNGFHTLYVRTKDADGKWSLTNYGSFIKYQAPTGIAAAGNIVRMEYFIDTDPGFGNGGSIPFTHAPDVNALVANIDLTTIPNGFHTMYIRSMDTLGKWSLTNYATFTGGQQQPPTASITVMGSTTFCLGAGTYLQANYSASATYQWKLNNNNISGATGITYVPVQSGSYTVVVTNGMGSATSSPVTITVNPVPTANISANGSLTFCQGGSVTLSVNATANATYRWRVYGNNINGATSTSYSVTSSGIYDVVVTGSNGCTAVSAKDTVVVNPSPSAYITPSGNTSFCSGDSVTLYANTGTGLTYLWSNNATTSSIKVFTQGNYSLTVTNSTNCTASATAVPVTVLSAPSATITPNGPTTFCNGGNVVLAANTGTGLGYYWSNGLTTSSITVTTGGTYYVTVSNAGCSKVSSPVTVTVNPGPTVNITGTSDTVCQGNPDTLTASGATTYTWLPATWLNTASGAQVISTPASTTTYTVTGTTGGCIGTASFTVNVSPNNTQVSATATTVCSGLSTTLNASGANSYTWSPAATLSSPTGASVTATPLAQTTYTVTGTSGSCTSTANITINVNAVVTPSVTISTPQTTVCGNTSVTFTALPTNGGTSPSYQWYKNGVVQSGNSNTFTLTSPSNKDSVWCIMTSSATCPVPATVSSNHIVMTVNPMVTPSIAISVNQNPVCVGTQVIFTATITNGGTNPTYVWKKNNVTVGGNSATYTLASPANNDSVWCVLTSNVPCASQATVTANKIKMVVTPLSPPTLTVSASQNPICVGASVTFSASSTNGGNAPSYQWYKNGTAVGSDADVYITNSLANNDSVWCVMTSNATCASPLTAIGNKVIITIAPNVTPSVSVSASSTSVCAGTSVTFTATATNGGTSPSYQWYKNGVVQSGNTNTYSSTVSNNDSVWCVMTSNATCPVPATAASNKVHMVVNPSVTPTISISASKSLLCAGDSVTFTATITNGGANPSYQWKKNGVNVGANAAIFKTATLANNDSVWCVLTSNAACPVPVSVASNKIRLTVNPIVAPAVSVTASQNNVCQNTNVTFTATATNGGTSPSYQWYKNGVAVGTNVSTYSFSGFASGDSVWCVLTSNANCVLNNTATSNKVVVNITATVVPSVSVSASSTSVCAGTSVTFTATATNGGTSPSYQWYKNGVVQSGNTNTYSSTVSNNDSVWCVMTSNATCPVPATAASNKVHMVVNPSVTPTISISASKSLLCAGDSVTFTATITNGGANPSYQWKKNGVNVGANAAIFKTATLANNDSVWCVLTSNAACPVPASVASNKIRLTVNPIVAPAVSVAASQNNVCQNTNVTFTATATNGGTSPSYQWYKNGVAVGTNVSTYSFSGFASGDSVWCVLTSNANCVLNNTATSNKVVVNITATVVPSVSVSASSTSVCAGTSVTFTATATNGGTSPSYQWYKNGVVQSGNTNTYSSTVSNNDSVWCVMTSNATCPVPATAASNKEKLTVLQAAHSSISAAICQGDSYLFGGNSLTAGGVYYDTLFASAANGCDSIITLTLTINTVHTTNISATICSGSSYPFNGSNLTVGGTYRDTLVSSTQCDSFVVLSLVVNNSVTVLKSASICQGSVYSFGMKQLTESGVYRDTTQGSNTCDSITILTLSVHALPVPVIVKTGIDTLKTGVFVHYKWYKDGVQLPDTMQMIAVHAVGTYSVMVVDSNGCSDMSAAFNVVSVSVPEVSSIRWQVYPNPAENLLNIRAESLPENVQIELRDELGRILLIREEQSSVIREEIDLSQFASGMYLVVVRSPKQIYFTQRIIKN